MAFADNTTGGRSIIEGRMPFRIVLAATVLTGDSLGASGGTWIKATAAANPVLVAGQSGASGDTITAYRSAHIAGITGATIGGAVYNSAGGYASTGTVKVGFCPTATEMLIDLTNLPWDETKDVVFSNYFGAPALQTATYVHANVTCPTSDTTTVTTAITNPDVPRNVTIKGNQATVTGNVVINGTDINDDTLTETIASNGTAEVAGAKAFKTVTSFVIPTRGAASDAISIGVGVLLGFKQNVGAAANVLVVLVDRVITAPGAIAVSTTVTASNTIDMSSVTYDATKVIVAFIAGT